MKKYLKENFLSLISIRKQLQRLEFETKALFLHILNNKFFLPKKINKIKKINFGCGSDIKEGFVNVDMNRNADIYLDVRNKLNIETQTIEYIYSSHFLEHLEHWELVAHLKECYRILKKGGAIRIGIPIFEKLFGDYYTHNDERYERMREKLSDKFAIPKNLICRMDLINNAVYEHGLHKTCIDYEKMQNILIFVGFEKDKIRKSEYEENIDVETRKNTTVYVEAEK